MNQEVADAKKLFSRFTTEELKAKLAECDVATHPYNIALNLLLDEKNEQETERRHQDGLAVGQRANRMAKIAIFISLVALLASFIQLIIENKK